MPEESSVLLFVKALVAGRVKSRIAAAVGDEFAMELYRNFILDSVETLERSGQDVRIFVQPGGGIETVASLIGRRHRYYPQIGQDLGSRMEQAFQAVFEETVGRAVLIGSDIPDLEPAILHEAVASLGNHDAVIGPAADGGYYLIGFTRRAFLPTAFRNIAWSTPTVLAGTERVLRGASLRFHRVPTWFDVDTLDDLRALFERGAHSAFAGSRTMAFLAENKPRLFPAGSRP